MNKIPSKHFRIMRLVYGDGRVAFVVHSNLVFTPGNPAYWTSEGDSDDVSTRRLEFETYAEAAMIMRAAWNKHKKDIIVEYDIVNPEGGDG